MLRWNLTLYKLLVFRVFVGLHGVSASSLIALHDRVLISVVTPVLRSGHVILSFQRNSVKFFHVGLRVSLFVHGFLILLVSEVALHNRSAIALVRGIQSICCSFEFL